MKKIKLKILLPNVQPKSIPLLQSLILMVGSILGVTDKAALLSIKYTEPRLFIFVLCMLLVAPYSFCMFLVVRVTVKD